MLKYEKEILETIEKADLEAQDEYNNISREIKLQEMIVQLAENNVQLLKEKKEAVSHYKTKVDIIYNYLDCDLSKNEKTVGKLYDM